MDYVLGIDSGGTNYRVEAQDTDGHQLGYYVGQPANHYNFAKEEWQNRINENIDACLAQFGGQRSKVKALVCGTTGIDSDADEVMLNAFYRSLPGFACPMQVVNDAELAHYTVTGGTGVLVISGTGSIAYGRSRDGRTCRTGGWMFTIEGDEGSGTWVSRMALRQVGRYLEGAAPESPLTRAVCATLSIHTRDDLNSVALAGGQAPWGMPHLGKLVNESAEEGDVAAVKILQQAAGLIALLVEDNVAALNLTETEPDFIIGLWGSSLLYSRIMLDACRTRLQQKFPWAIIRMPNRTATEGAADWAWKLTKTNNEL